MTPLRRPLFGYFAAVVIPLGIMLAGTRLGMSAFVFEHLVVLLVVGVAVCWGMRPALVTALVSALGDNILLRDPAGRPTITGIRDVIDLALFVIVAVTVGWLVASARRERALAEKAVERERQARADRDRLVAMVSHDLATPLGVVRGSVQAARLARTGAAVDMERLWERVDRASARATTLVRALTEDHALGSGELTLDLRRVDLRSLITSVVQMMDRMSERHPVSLAPGEEAVIVECDDQRMMGVFENLLSNAIKYSPDGGPIEVSVTRRIDDVIVSVKDYGMGISSDALPHIFERGYRACEAVRTAPGLGLGLSTAAEIVKRHRGTIPSHGREWRHARSAAAPTQTGREPRTISAWRLVTYGANGSCSTDSAMCGRGTEG
jgi:signal transduction histidine kinase